MPLSPEAVRWFHDRRGITEKTLEAFGVTTEALDVVVFPYDADVKKYRKGFEKSDAGGRKFWWDPPGRAGQLPFLPPGFEPGSHMILVEGETDTMSAWQAAPPEAQTSLVGLSGTGSWSSAIRGVQKGRRVGPDRLEELFGQAKVVWVVFDQDDPYESPDAAQSTDRAWQEIKADLGRKAKRVTLPQGISDVAEFMRQYDWAAFRVLLQKALKPVRHYPRLDLTKPVPETDWLVEDLLVKGEATVVAADSGTGKSWLGMALGLAVAGDGDEFLGLKLRRNGRVMIVDEENPGALVHQRLASLGMTPAQLRNLEYIWQAGVDLVHEPHKLYEEAMELEPELIVLDSLSRIALGVEENDNTAMSLLFKTGIVPLARDTGAAVLVLHHTPSDNAGKPRGATAIKAAADQVLSMIAATGKGGTKTGNVNLFPSKPRRQLTTLTFRIEGDMEKEGRVWLARQKTTDEVVNEMEAKGELAF